MKHKLYIIGENVLHLPLEDAGREFVRVNNAWIGKQGEKGKFYRRQPVILDKPSVGLKSLRFVMGSRPDQLVGCKNSLMIDYDTKIEIGYDETHIVNVLPASAWDVYQYYWAHPLTPYRVSTRLGVLGVVLGLLGAVLGAISPFV